MEKFAIFVVWLISFNTNAFSASHFFKLPISCSSSAKIMKCAFNLQNDGYCLKWRRWKNRKKVSWWFFVCLYSLSQLFNAINDNCRVWFSDSRFMFHDSSWSFLRISFSGKTYFTNHLKRTIQDYGLKPAHKNKIIGQCHNFKNILINNFLHHPILYQAKVS